MNSLLEIIEKNFDTILLLLLIFFLIKEGGEDTEVIVALGFLLISG